MMRKFGLLFTHVHRDMYLPIFCEDRELAYSVLIDAMKKWSETKIEDQGNYVRSYHLIAEELATEKCGSGPCYGSCFIGSEAVSPQCFGGVDSACKDAAYIFATDFDRGEIVTLK